MVSEVLSEVATDCEDLHMSQGSHYGFVSRECNYVFLGERYVGIHTKCFGLDDPERFFLVHGQKWAKGFLQLAPRFK